MNIAEVLTRAADVIDERGWCQGEAWAPGGQVCAHGAIWEALGIDRIDYDQGELTTGARPVFGAACDAIRRHIGPGRSVTGWNDEPGRTKDDVTAALRAAAKVVTA